MRGISLPVPPAPSLIGAPLPGLRAMTDRPTGPSNALYFWFARQARSRSGLRSSGVAGEPRRLDVAVGRGHAGAAVLGDLLADPAERAVAGHVVGPLARPQVFEQLVHLVVGDPVEVAVVDLQARRLGAGRDALDVLERELAVGGRAAGMDAQAGLQVLQQLFAPSQHAGDVGAHVDDVIAHRLALEHLVE